MATWETCFSEIEFVYLNGPFRSGENSYRWSKKTLEGKTTGWVEATNYVIRFMNEQGPFDGLIGYSQGS